MGKIKYLQLACSLVICQLAGILGTIFTTPSSYEWYDSLNKPFFTPPDWIFGPAWIILYFLMGISLYLVWNTRTNNAGLKRRAMLFFAIQLVLNSLWSILFFGGNFILVSLVDIIFLLLSIGITMYYFFKLSKVAGYLLIPYLGWVIFAALLNLFIFLLN